LGIAAIEAHFTNAELVPELLSTFDPSALMTVAFSVGDISPGQNLTMTQVASAPELTITPANSSVSLTGNYTLVMADADIVGTNESTGQTRHWLVNGVVLKAGNSSNSSTTQMNVSTADGTAVTAYAGPAPAAGSGPHRYVILLLPQPSTFSPPANLSKSGVGVSVFELTDYISESHLGQPVAGMYFTVEQGTTNVTIPTTSAVISSTLKPATPASSTASGSASTAKQSGSSTKNAATRSGNSLLAIPASVIILLASYLFL
jgi:phosphatidylethanolamine-binding protein (PEBP) family uncharacterized protein